MAVLSLSSEKSYGGLGLPLMLTLLKGIVVADAMDDVVVFHAGTKRDDRNRYVTSGGRVLGVTALGPDLGAARDRAYEAVARIRNLLAG